MKNLLLFLFSALTHSFIYSQTTTIIYELSPDKVELNKLIEKSKLENNTLPERYQNIVNDSHSLEYTLDIAENKAYYKEIESLDLDNNTNINLTKLADLANFILTSKKGNKHRVLIKSPFMDEFLVELPNVTWHIENEEKYILNKKCLKAKGEFSVLTGNKYVTSTVEAWFSPEIPLPFGPGRFSGLPGLILKLKTSNHFVYTAKEILLTNRKIDYNVKPSISEKEYLHILDNIRRSRS